MSQTGIARDLRAFTVSLLERSGGVVDWPDDAPRGEAMLPAESATWFGLPDTFAVSQESIQRGLHVALAGEFLDLAGQVLDARFPHIGEFSLGDLYLKKGDLQGALEKAFYFPNARVRYQASQPATVAYHTWWFHVELRSEETWEWRPMLSLNVESGAPVKLPDPLQLGDLAPGTTDAPQTDTFSVARRSVERQLPAAAGPFLERLDGRHKRDQKRLRDYYNAMLRDVNPSSRRKVEITPQQVEDRAKAVKLEMQRKLGELDERYAVDGRMRALLQVRWQMPVLAIDLEVKRKQAVRLQRIYWNSLLKDFEPVACSKCGQGIFTLHFANQDAAPCCEPCFGAS